MKYCGFELNGQSQYGLVETVAGAEQITRLLLKRPEESDGDIEDLPSKRMDPLTLPEAKLLAPVRPSKIVCVGRNYREHAQELGNEVPVEPLLFFKPPSSLLRPGGTILLPAASARVDHEGELALVIGQRASNLQPDADLRSVIRGYTLANDVTARDLQKKDGQWTRAKGFDTFCPAGPWVSNEVDPGSGLIIETRVNGELRQRGSTADFIFSIPQLLAYITAAITLEPGDLVLTGTPSGVGPLAPGDRVDVSVTGLGILTNQVAPAHR